MPSETLTVDGVALERVGSGDYVGTRGTLRLSLHEWRDEDGMPDGWEGRGDGIAPEGFTYTIVVVGGRTATDCAARLTHRIAGVRAALEVPRGG